VTARLQDAFGLSPAGLARLTGPGPASAGVYAIVGDGDTTDNPLGLARRLETDWGFTDETLQEDFSWSFTPVILEWERGDFADELVEISHEQADKIIQHFRGRQDPFGPSVDS
jgi:hypothetical protein